MKSTFRNILFLSLILSGINSIAQNHCIPISESRRLHEDAVRSYVQDTLLQKQATKINLLEEEKKEQRDDFEMLVIISEEKFKKQVQLTEYEHKLGENYKSEADYFRKKNTKQTLKKWPFIIGAVLIGYAVGKL